MCPRSRDPPTAMVNSHGILVTDHKQIKEMAEQAYKERLRNRPIREGLEYIQEEKKGWQKSSWMLLKQGFRIQFNCCLPSMESVFSGVIDPKPNLDFENESFLEKKSYL